jgi:amino acid adenylation domain-containing protein
MNSLVTKLRKLKIELGLVDGKLKMNAPEGVMTPELLAEIKANKEQLTAYIHKISNKSEFFEINKTVEKEHYALSSVQSRLYFLYEMDVAAKAVNMNMPSMVYLMGDLDMERLTTAFRKLIQRHESLRTYFHILNDFPVQKIAPTFEFEMEYFEAGTSEIDATLKKFIRQFDLNKPPLLRAGVIKVEHQKYVLMVDMHHIISDGTSERIMVKEFMAFYNNEELPELKLQFKDFAEWEQSEAQQNMISKLKDFWLNEFAEDATVLELPTDAERPLIKVNEGALYNFKLSVEETKLLKQLAENEGSTMFMVMVSIFNIFLSKLSNQEDIVIGTPTAGRQHADLENIIGMFVNTVPLRNYPKGNLTFREFLKDLKAKTINCFDNQAYQLDALINELKLKRDSRRSTLFDFMFVFQNFDYSELQIPGLTLKSFEYEHIMAQFDITLTALDLNDQISLNLVYSTALFKKETIKRFEGYLRKIVAAATSNVHTKISQINILSEEEKHKLLIDFNATSQNFSGFTNLVDSFETQVQKTPENIALIWNEQKMTYRELNERANQLAHHLQDKGVKKETIVGLMIERSFEMIIGLIGILKAGGTYLPVDTNLPQSRVLKMMEDSKALFLLTETGELKKEDQLINIITTLDREIVSSEKTNVELSRNASDVAYIIYTSGSAGEPKGVMVKHGAVMNLVHSRLETFQIKETERVLQFSSISFDASVEQIWLPLLSGAASVLIDKGVVTDNAAFNNYMRAHHVTHLDTTPSFLESIELTGLTSLKRIITGGEECKVTLAKKLSKDFTLYNEYGPTETTIVSVACEITEKEANCARIPIGKPVHNTQIYILGKYKELLPIGVQGELYIGGAGLSKGYLNDPGLTAEKFVDNPFVPGEFIYRTGDMAKWLPDGSLEYYGRIDGQVKIRGFRIELGEIDNQLSYHEEIKEVVVIAKERDNEKHLIAYYTGEKEIASMELRDFLSRRLPEYMIPSRYVFMEHFPLTTNGKINKRLLPEPQMVVGDDYVMPANELEHNLVCIWSEILKIDKESISTEKSFFEIGGHSLRAMVLSNKVLKELNMVLPLKEIFERPTIKQQAEYIKINEWLSVSAVESTEKTEVVI